MIQTKLKAVEIFEKMLESQSGVPDIEDARDCALIAVAEVLMNVTSNKKIADFYLQVKIEIEKL